MLVNSEPLYQLSYRGSFFDPGLPTKATAFAEAVPRNCAGQGNTCYKLQMIFLTPLELAVPHEVRGRGWISNLKRTVRRNTANYFNLLNNYFPQPF